jgi:hypothetical protein
MLHNRRYEVICLTSDPHFFENKGCFNVPWLPDIPIWQIRTFDKNKGGSTLLQKRTNWLENKIGAGVAYLTGFNIAAWHEINIWIKALQYMIKEIKPDLIYVRGAGQKFFPHLAMTQITTKIDWIANYHDPFPLSLYPPPYRKTKFLLSRMQELHNEKILSRASWLTFPSKRLMIWMLKDKFKKYQYKASVIPHLAMDLPAENTELPPESLIFEDGYFNLVHTGTLLRQRAPWALIKAIHNLIERDPEFSRTIRVYFIGGVDALIKSDRRWQEFLSMNQVYCFENRLSYHQTLLVSKKASALVLLEASAIESPFFPAKLADYLWLRKPILALSPKQSVAIDLLGSEYPFQSNPDDEEAIQQKIYELWRAWKDQKLNDFIPSYNSLEPLTESMVFSDLEKIINLL